MALAGQVEVAEISGSDTFVHLQTPEGDLVAQLTGVHRLELGEAVGVHFNVAQAYVFDASERLAVAPAWRHTHRLHGIH